MSLAIMGWGSALAPHAASQAQALALAQDLWPYTQEQRRLLPALYRRTGVAQRHTVLHLPDGAPLHAAGHDAPDRRAPSASGACIPSTAERMRAYAESAGPLACAAAAAAVHDAGIEPGQLTHLVTVSCTGAAAPGLDVALIRRLELRDDVQRTHVGFMGCQGALVGLRVARAFADADADARVLVCAVELCSLHFHYGWDPEKVVANALFADGAAALVGRRGTPTPALPTPTPPTHAFPPRARPARTSWELTGTGSCLLPDCEDAMTWTIGDHGFLMTLSPRVPALIAEHLRPWLLRWLDAQGSSPERIGSWAVHPGGPRILSAVEAALSLPRAATTVSREVLAEHGNMSSPTILFILQRLVASDAPRPCVALAFGPGLAVEAALLA